MAYQIKSTPYIRRIVSTSKKNGELQRLKDEYERLKEFNERSIETKMRQVRLKRLYWEIEQIKNTSMKLANRKRPEKPKTPEQLRKEALAKARELGKDYSKMNSFMVDRSYMRKSASNTGKHKKDFESKSRSHKRIEYGNEISRFNLEKIKDGKKSTRKPVEPVKDEDKKNLLISRLNYGNSRSSFNMSRKVTKAKSGTAAKNILSNLRQSPETTMGVTGETASVTSNGRYVDATQLSKSVDGTTEKLLNLFPIDAYVMPNPDIDQLDTRTYTSYQITEVNQDENNNDNNDTIYEFVTQDNIHFDDQEIIPNLSDIKKLIESDSYHNSSCIPIPENVEDIEKNLTKQLTLNEYSIPLPPPPPPPPAFAINKEEIKLFNKSNNEENRLRMVSNATDLHKIETEYPTNSNINNNIDHQNDYDDDDDDVDERVLKVDEFYEANTYPANTYPGTSNNDLKDYPSFDDLPPPPSPLALMERIQQQNKFQPKISKKFQEYIAKFESNIREVAETEAAKLCERRFSNIFEHQHQHNK